MDTLTLSDGWYKLNDRPYWLPVAHAPGVYFPWVYVHTGRVVALQGFGENLETPDLPAPGTNLFTATMKFASQAKGFLACSFEKMLQEGCCNHNGEFIDEIELSARHPAVIQEQSERYISAMKRNMREFPACGFGGSPTPINAIDPNITGRRLFLLWSCNCGR